MNRIFKAVAYIFVALLIFATVAFGYYYVIKVVPDHSARRMVGPPATILSENGFTFRDLNKNGRLDIYEDSRQPVEKRVDDLLHQMTVEEKAGMMFHNFVLLGPHGELANPLNPMNLLTAHVAVFSKKMNHFNLFFIDNVEDIAGWTNRMQELAERSRLGIPITFSTDPIHTSRATGTVIGSYLNGISHWCEPIGFAAIRDSAFTVQFGRIAAKEYRSMGVHSALHPMADLATEPRWGRISGTFGEDQDLSALLTAAYIYGFQGDSINAASVACMTKHFPGGGPQKDGEDPHYHYGREQIYPGNNFQYHLKPFVAAIRAKTAQMMPYYGVPVNTGMEEVGFGFHKEVISDLLRDSLEYEGIVCTDWGIVSDIKMFGITFYEAKDYGVEQLTESEKIRKAIEAGVDQFGGEHVPELLTDLVKRGTIGEERIDESVRRLLRLKFQLGLFENPYVNEKRTREICGAEEFVKKGYESQLRSQVLLTNKNVGKKKILPLEKGTKIYLKDFNSNIASAYTDVVNNLSDADVAILNLSTPYEKRSTQMDTLIHQGRLYFTQEELAPLLAIMKEKPTIVVLYLERPAVLPEIAESSSAMLVNFGATDEAIFDVLFGRYNPTGKLPFEMPSSSDAVENQKEDLPYDSKDPLFPFGHGLSYLSSHLIPR